MTNITMVIVTIAVVIGSIYSSMEKIFANQHEPLWGRSTDELVLKSLIESSNFKVILEKFKQNFSSYKGMAFEELVLELLKTNYHLFPYEEWGQYWDKNRKSMVQR